MNELTLRQVSYLVALVSWDHQRLYRDLAMLPKPGQSPEGAAMARAKLEAALAARRSVMTTLRSELRRLRSEAELRAEQFRAQQFRAEQ